MLNNQRSSSAGRTWDEASPHQNRTKLKPQLVYPLEVL